MSMLNFVIVGHVDHGKSSLIGRLLFETNSLSAGAMEEVTKTSQDLGREVEFAYLLDHLEEERQQGITIDTTQVFFKTDRRDYVIIDAPGHVEFVKNMITGASQAEAAVLIVDVKEGVQQQTKRHAYILSLLGLSQVVVVLNKMDLVDYSRDVFETVRNDIEAFLAPIGVRPLFYIPIAATKGENISTRSAKMPWHQGPTFLECLDSLRNTAGPETKPLLMPIQDIYKLGDKRIAAGRIEAGMLRAGQKVRILPTGEATRIKTIEKFPEQVETAGTGESIGLTTADPSFIERGSVLCELEKEPKMTDQFEATMFWMSKKDLKKGDRLTIRCATQEQSCRLESITRRIDSSSLDVLAEDADILKNLEVGEVVIKTKNPVVLTKFTDVKELGRFVMVRDENICAGGI
ncbi:MAG TPA: GTP-binding protein, partial [Sedimentisphaerales bacterium]|nr:GTP-binding protein [Sedimentisphaerales bacterium]